MKKYLLIGLAILIGTNIVALSGVAFNRMGDAITQLTLTERELSLPYNRFTQKENSGLSLSIDWRTPTDKSGTYYSYNSHDISLTKDDLLALGFNTDVKDNYWVESRELYWALEFDGDLHKAEIIKAENRYQTALKAFEADPNDINSRNKKEYRESLTREKTINSRLFFIEASTHYEPLATQFSEQKNIIIVKGLAKPYYYDQAYSLKLRHLLVGNIMVPVAFSDILSDLKRMNRRDKKSPRYSVDINWGNRLEPWIIDVNGLVD